MENRVRYLLFFVFCMFLYPLVTEAECSYERISELSKMASNVQLSYTYELKQTIEYDVHITNLTNDLYAMDNEGNAISGNSDVSLHFVYDERKLFSPGEAISYRFYSNDVNCKDEYLMTKYITLPKYNRFALSDECKKYPGFKYCSLWDYTDLDLDTFDSNRFKPIKNRGEVKNMAKQVFNSFVSNRIKIPDEDLSAIKTDNGGIIRINGMAVGIYKNKDGKIFAVDPTCTHLGCLLTWNNVDKTWDCPCHGSRFDYKGKNLYDPAFKDLETYGIN